MVSRRLRPWQITARMSDAELRELDDLVDALTAFCAATGTHPAECDPAGIALHTRSEVDRSSAIRWAITVGRRALPDETATTL